MVRQARSGVTRQRIVNSAVDLFYEFGYPATGLSDIINRAEMTKGALYYHFDSKESLATAIIEESGANILNAFRRISESPSPALENIIHGMFVVTDFIGTDKLAQVGVQLLRAIGGFNEAAGRTYADWIEEVADRVAQAGAEGDLRTDLDARDLSELILAAVLGGELLSNATSRGSDLRQRVTRMWEILLPEIVNDESVGYFREFLSREALRRFPTPPPG